MTEDSLRSLIDLIGDKEAARRGYNQLYSFAERAIGPVTLTDMMVSEVRALQDTMIDSGSRSSAVGRYQFVRRTLDDLIRIMGLSGNERFDAHLQDRLAIRLLERRGLSKFMAGQITRDQFANGIAHEWASMPCIGGPRHGRPSPDAMMKSCYAGDGLNVSSVSPEVFLAVIDGLKPSAVPPTSTNTSVRLSMSEPKWLNLAREYLGEREISGSRHNSEIVKWFAESGHAWVQDDETAWCAGFVGAMLSRAGTKGSGQLNARSYLNWGAPLDDPIPGCIVVFSRGDPNGWQGHVAFFLRTVGEQIEVLGGNQGNAVSIAKYPKSRLLGYRWPTSTASAAARPGQTTAEVRRLQTMLDELGYHEVGKIDGSWGTKTRAALLAFKADNDMPLTADVDESTWAMLAQAQPREIGEERANTTAADLKGKSRVVDNTGNIQKASGAITVASVAAGVVKNTGDPLETANEIVGHGNMIQQLIQNAYSLAGFAVEHWWVLVPVGGGLMWWWAHKAKAARIEDERTGRHA